MGNSAAESHANAADRWLYVGVGLAAAQSALWAVPWLLCRSQRLAPARCVAMAATGVIQFVAARGLSVRGGRAATGRCVQCGYDLTRNSSGVCPECGMAVAKGVTP